MTELMENGPGLRLIDARHRVRVAVLAIIAGEAGACVDMPWIGSQSCERAYSELSAAAIELAGAQDGWDEHVAKHEARLNAGAGAKGNGTAGE